MSAADRAWTAAAVVLAVTLLAIGQVSLNLPVYALQVISSGVLAGFVTCVIRRLWEALEARRAAPVAGLSVAATGHGKNPGLRRYVLGFLRDHPDADLAVHDAKAGQHDTDDTDGGTP